MQSVTVRYLGLVRNAVGKQQEVVDLAEGSTVRDVLNTLAERHGDSFRFSVLTRDHRLRPAARLLLDGVEVDEAHDFDVRLENGSKLTIVVLVNPVVGG